MLYALLPLEEIREAGNSIGTHLYHDDASLDELERIAADLDFEYKSFSTDHLFSRLFEGVCINNKPFANIVESLDHYAFRRIFKKHGGSIKAVMRKPLSA